MSIATIKNTKRLLATTLSVLMICHSAVAAPHKSNFEFGMESAAIGKNDIAIRYFKRVPESDPNYKEARNQIALAEQKQSEASKASKAQTQINQDTERCRTLFERDRSPDAFDCVEHLKTMQKEASEEFENKDFSIPDIETLNTAMAPYQRFDDLADRIRGIALDENGLENAQTDLEDLENFLRSPEQPQDLKTMGAVVLTQFYKGATLAFRTACQDAREGTDQQAADKICGRHEFTLGKYTWTKGFLDQNVKLLGNKQVPSRAYALYKPIGEKAATLPDPKEMALERTSRVIPPVSPETKSEEPTAFWMPYVPPAIGVVVLILGATFWKRLSKATPTQQKTIDNRNSQQSHASQSPVYRAPEQVKLPTTVTPVMPVSVAPQRQLMEVLVEAWKNGDAVPRANDLNLKNLIGQAGKLGITVEQSGQPRSAYLTASISDPRMMTDVARECVEVIKAATRKK